MSTKEQINPLSFILEPLVVVGLLTTGCLINRRRGSEIRKVYELSANIDVPDHLPFLGWSIRVPNNSRFRANITSRFLAYFPFLMEVWYWILTYWVYQIARACLALSLEEETKRTAQKHGAQVFALEHALHIEWELATQKFIMRFPLLLDLLNKLYSYVHITATIAFMDYSYKFFTPALFQRVRRTLVLCNLLAFVIFTAWPCMPPRLMPFEKYGFVDTVHAGKHASVWTTNKFQNQLAAMPSMHFGYSFIIGSSLLQYSPHRIMRILGPLYPAVILLAIVCTGNHYLLDAFVGFLVTLVAWRINTAVLQLRPLEEWGFWLCRTEKPMDKEKYERLIGPSRYADAYSPIPSPNSVTREVPDEILAHSPFTSPRNSHAGRVSEDEGRMV